MNRPNIAHLNRLVLICNAYKIYKTYTSEKSSNMEVSITGVTVFSYDKCNLLINVQISLGNALVCIMGYVWSIAVIIAAQAVILAEHLLYAACSPQAVNHVQYVIQGTSTLHSNSLRESFV